MKKLFVIILIVLLLCCSIIFVSCDKSTETPVSESEQVSACSIIDYQCSLNSSTNWYYCRFLVRLFWKENYFIKAFSGNSVYPTVTTDGINISTTEYGTILSSKIGTSGDKYFAPNTYVYFWVSYSALEEPTEFTKQCTLSVIMALDYPNIETLDEYTLKLIPPSSND